GMRDWSVTGVQTCALPILDRASLMGGVAALLGIRVPAGIVDLNLIPLRISQPRIVVDRVREAARIKSRKADEDSRVVTVGWDRPDRKSVVEGHRVGSPGRG